MKWFVAFLLVLSLSLSGSPAIAGQAEYNRAFRESTETGKPLVVIVGASWCPACQVQKNEMLQSDPVSAAIVIYVDIDQDKSLAQDFYRDRIPTTHVFYPDGNGGWHPKDMFVGLLHSPYLRNRIAQKQVDPQSKPADPQVKRSCRWKNGKWVCD